MCQLLAARKGGSAVNSSTTSAYALSPRLATERSRNTATEFWCEAKPILVAKMA